MEADFTVPEDMDEFDLARLATHVDDALDGRPHYQGIGASPGQKLDVAVAPTANRNQTNRLLNDAVAAANSWDPELPDEEDHDDAAEDAAIAEIEASLDPRDVKIAAALKLIVGRRRKAQPQRRTKGRRQPRGRQQ